MERVLLAALGERAPRTARPAHSLSFIDEHALFLQLHALELGTVKGYSTGARDYTRFCITHHLPLDPTPLTLSHYIAYTSQFIASGPKYLSEVRHFLHDLYPHFDANRHSPLVQATIRGLKKIRADPIRRKLPLRRSHLATFNLLARMSGSYDDLLFVTLLSCSFYGCHRTGELVWKNDKQLQDYCKLIKRSSLIFSDGRAQYHLPYHKSDPFYHGSDVLFTHQDIADPIQLLHDYTTLRDSRHGP
ncbi:hypothetical protein ARMGADRAFT_1082719 [Armillaria gallica]|uniref:Uncharacterized protein n=1 Tax=Armillaria gallica TaxID=47427 RepID=A0A2H3DHW8_ARMGA|nr:hypothetical protein ARMGADRAFT_1082719 [Armillaria gallica]